MSRWWTLDELVERKRLPRRRLVDAVRSGAFPVAAGSKDDDVLISLPALDWWLSEERFTQSWLERDALRGTVYADGVRKPQRPKEKRSV